MAKTEIYATLEIRAEGTGTPEEVLEKALKSKKFDIIDSKLSGQPFGNYISLPAYAKLYGYSDTYHLYLRKMCKRGAIPGAVKIGRNWAIPKDYKRTDGRIKEGKYVGVHHIRNERKKAREAKENPSNAEE